MVVRARRYVHCLPCVFYLCPYSFSISCMLAPFIILCRVQEFSIGQVLSTSPTTHLMLPHRSGSSWSCVNPVTYAVPLTSLHFICQLPIVLRLLLFLGTICICVDSITCPFDFTWRVFLTYYRECTWHFSPMKLAISETYCDVQTESFRQILFSTGVQVSSGAWIGRAVYSVGQTASLFHQMPGCRLRLAYEAFFYAFALLVLITRRSGFKWRLKSVIWKVINLRHVIRRHGRVCAVSSMPQVTKPDARAPTLEQETWTPASP